MKTICNHCNSTIPDNSAREWRGWVDPSTQAHCDAMFQDCPLCGFVSCAATHQEPETPQDAEFIAFAQEQLGLLSAGKPNAFTASIKL